MANIKQQKKRIGVAARQRLENLRYKSAAKTLLKTLQLHVETGDKEAAAGTHRELVSLLDRAASRRALHRNTVARKKSRAARILVSEPKKEAAVVRRAKKKAPLRKPKSQRAEAAAAVAEAKPAAKTSESKRAIDPNVTEMERVGHSGAGDGGQSPAEPSEEGDPDAVK